MLPRSSAYTEAMAGDEELAQHLPDRGDEPAAPQRRMSEYTAEVELLSVVADRLAEVVNVIIAVNRGRPGKVTPMPRPVTAMDRLRRRRREHNHKSLVARVLPDRIT